MGLSVQVHFHPGCTQTFICTQLAWHYAVDIWNSLQDLNGIIPWTAAVIPIVGGFVSVGVQFFYAWRIWSLGKNKTMKGLACLISLISLTQGISALVAGFMGAPHTTQDTLLRLHPAFYVLLTGSFVCDILITACMFWILYTAKSQTSFSQSHAIINRLISNTIQTGAVTVVISAVDLALFIRFTDSTYHFVP
ncbi:hypothetical protein MPER_07609, partial [Moniliophthora perniciosa FA553]